MMIIKDTGNGCIATSYGTDKAYKEYVENEETERPVKSEAYEERKANLQENEILAPEVLPTEDPLFWYIENGELKVKLAEAIEAEELKRLSLLEIEAQDYQDSVMSKNEASALLGRTVSEMKTKAKANYDWLQSLWGLYYQKKIDSSNDTNYSSIGDKPYSFVELQQEEAEL